MNMEALLAKLKELKIKMAELENAEGGMPSEAKEESSEAESPEVEKLEAKVDVLDLGKEEPKDEMSDEDLMSAFGKKKKEAPKPGMKLAIASGKSKGKPLFGKHK
jgi:hypothetical protein